MHVPEQIGKYEILGQIASGGFGVIYRARDPHIGREVAIKMCSTPDAEVRQRFEREARVVGNLVHPNITLVFDYGLEGDVPYIVQELLSGYDLDQLAGAAVLSDPTTVVSILIQVCDGLDYAHQRGVIHRDIKPSNIRVLEDGTVKIMDFGIAKSLDGGSKLTQTGVALGTAGYLAPEQIQGGEVDGRADIFALGVVGYELLTGVRPFAGSSLSNVLYRILNDEPEPPAKISAACPPDLDAVIRRAMAKAPGERWQSARELGDALRRIGVALDALPSDDTTAVLRRMVRRMDGLGENAATRELALREPAPRPAAAVLSRTPTPPADSRRSPAALIFLLLLLVLLGSTAIIILSPGAQKLVFGPGGPPWIPTPTPTATPTATPTPSPTPTPETEPTPPPTPSQVTVRLVIDPPAEVTVDGRGLGGGRIASGEVRLTPGRHTFTMLLPDYPSQTLFRNVDADTRVLSLTMDVGLVTILPDQSSAPPGGIAFLDGRSLGSIPIVRKMVASGEHELTVRWSDAEHRQRLVVPRLPGPAVVVVVAPPAAP